MIVSRFLPLAMALTASAFAADKWVPLFNGKNLDGWDSVGDGVWTVMKDGTLLGQRERKALHQALLYTKKDFGEFDLHLEYWTRLGGNSGISIRDSSRGQHSIAGQHDPERTPSHIGYEVQISMGYPGEKYPTGSIYLFQQAKTGAQINHDWNALDIESRGEIIRVKVNGSPVAEHPGDPKRPKTGPIGLQLHDPQSVVMFRNIRIRAR